MIKIKVFKNVPGRIFTATIILMIGFLNGSGFYLPKNKILTDYKPSDFENMLKKESSDIDIKIKAIDKYVNYKKPIKIEISITNNAKENIKIPTFTNNSQFSVLYFGMFVIDFQISKIEGDKEINVTTQRPFQIYKTLPSAGNKELKPGEKWNVVVDLRLWLSSGETGYVKAVVESKNESGSRGGNLVNGNYKIMAIYNIAPWKQLTANNDNFIEILSNSNILQVNVK